MKKEQLRASKTTGNEKQAGENTSLKVWFESPINESEFQAGDSMTLDVRASDFIGAVEQIFISSSYEVVASRQYASSITHTVTLDSVGSYRYRGQAMDLGGPSTTGWHTFYAIGEGSKNVRLDLEEGTVYEPNETIEIRPTVSGDIGLGVRVTKIELYLENEIVSESIWAPYRFKWTFGNQGSYKFKVVVSLSEGEPIESDVVTVYVGEVQPPSGIEMASPQAGQVIPTPVAVRIEAIEALEGRSVTHLRILNQPINPAGDARELERIENPSFPVNWSWSDPAVGVHDLWAIAYLEDDSELRTERPRFTVIGSGDPTGVEMISPQTGQVTTAPVTVHVAATTALSGRSVTLIRIIDTHDDGETLEVYREENPTFPVVWNWTDPKLGLHTELWANVYLSDVEEPLRTEKVRFRVQPTDK